MKKINSLAKKNKKVKCDNRPHALVMRLARITLSVVLCLSVLPATGISFAFADEVAVASSSVNNTASLTERLAAIEGITDVADLEDKQGFAQACSAKIIQPLDWDNPDGTSFEQLIRLYYRGDKNVTVFYCGGYTIGKPNRVEELSERYNANVVCIEYRFFGESQPDGLDFSSTALWEYLTVENAASDFHNIINKTSVILSGKHIFTGTSKGGYTTNFQAYFQDQTDCNDIDAFVAYVAPLCNGVNDERIMDFVYNRAGDEAYGKEQAAEYRNLILQLQLELIRYREDFQQRYWDEGVEQGCKYREEFFTVEDGPARLYDVAVCDLAEGIWQYNLDFDNIRAILQMSEPEKAEAAFEYLVENYPVDSCAYTNSAFPYYMQSVMQMGNYKQSFSGLRAAIKAEQEADPNFPDLVITEDMEEDLCGRIYLTTEQQEAFSYSANVRDELIAWQDITKQHVLMIYGGLDPWNQVRIPRTDNPDIHTFTAQDNNHKTCILDLAQADQFQAWSLLDGWVQTDLSEAHVTLSGESFVQTGQAIEPVVTVSLDGWQLSQDADYTVTYTDNIEPGKATATVTGLASYTGSVAKSYTITSPGDGNGKSGSVAATGDNCAVDVLALTILLAACASGIALAARKVRE